jgi:GNAT superfamily N-acetyltransferase
MRTSRSTLFEVPSVLPGRLILGRGTARDYHAMQRFHYRPRRPAPRAPIRPLRYFPQSPDLLSLPPSSIFHPPSSLLVAIAILSWPTLSCSTRDRLLNLSQLKGKSKAKFLNRNVRTISRVAVHPTFRSLGLSTALVRCILYHCKTRYIEAIATMARAHPFFEIAGMTPHYPDDPTGPVYYLFDRHDEAQSYIAPASKLTAYHHAPIMTEPTSAERIA